MKVHALLGLASLLISASALADGQPNLSVAKKPGSAPADYSSKPPALQLRVPRLVAPRTTEFFIRRAPLTLNLDAPVAAGPECPAGNAGWREWRDATANQVLGTYVEIGGQKLLSHQEAVAKADQANLFIKECRRSPQFGQANEADAIIANLERFVQTLGINNYRDHRFGFKITDQEYINSTRAQAELPDLLKGQAFLKSVSNPATYKDAARMIEEHNRTLAPDQPPWEVLLYKSRFLGTPDDAQTNGRFFVYVKDGAVEKWIQFGIVTPGDPTRPINNLSIVAVGPPDAAGNRPTAILDHWRTHEADGSISLSTRYEKIGQTENCALCHKTSPLGIHPAEEYVIASDGRLVLNTTNPGEKPKKLNDRIETYGAPFFKDWIRVSDFGPTIGPTGRQRDAAFMRACTSRHMLSEASVSNVQRSMRCSSCHNEEALGPLNYPQSLKTDVTSRQLREYIVQGWMPPNNRLTSSEREALYSCLTQEYHDPTTQTGLLLDWLKGEAP